MSARLMTSGKPMFTAVTTTTHSNAELFSDYINIVFDVFSAGGTATIKVKGSMSVDKPDFTASASATNRWDYVGLVDLDNKGSGIAGSTGIGLTSGECKNIELNTNVMRWVCLEITAISGATIDATMYATNNE